MAANGGGRRGLTSSAIGAVLTPQSLVTGLRVLGLKVHAMPARRLIVAAFISTTSACAPFMRLPAPDPVWTATAGSAYDRPETASLEQKAATERARAYIAQSLPARSDAFIRDLEQQGFFCSVDGDRRFNCIYSKAQPRVPCAPSLRVSIAVDFPYGHEKAIVIAKDDIDVAALVVQDRDRVDHRGCFPL
jgi:hypothetical protein